MNLLFTSLRRPLIALSLSAAALLPAHAETPVPVPVEDFSVFVDMPTGFAFVKTPAGWHFVRQIEATKLSQLHPTTLVSVMQAGERLGQTDAKATSAAKAQSLL